MKLFNNLTNNSTIELFYETSQISLPDWAAAYMWLGAWCRSYKFDGNRLICFVVVPDREFAAQFAGLGALIEGATQFEDSLSWPRFKDLPIGSLVYWKHKQGKESFSGNIIGFTNEYDTDFIKIKVTKPVSKVKNELIQQVSERYFDSYFFTVEQPPSRSKIDSLVQAEGLIDGIVGNLNPKWIWSDGAEVMIVTNMGQFQESIEQISLGSDNRLKVKMIDLLCLGKTSDENHAKLRISHPRNEELGKYFPLVILDGKDGFGARHHLSNQSNVMIILNRSEYQEDINNSVLQLQAISEEAPRMHKKNIDMIFPAGFECAAYIVKVA